MARPPLSWYPMSAPEPSVSHRSHAWLPMPTPDACRKRWVWGLLAHNLGLQTVAEGVETREIWNRLIVLGCDAAQGNYVSGPLEPQKVAAWITEWESPWHTPA